MKRTDNLKHKVLFSIPVASHSTAIATVKPLPPQRKITGHKQTDAYLWVLDVIKTNEPAHLDSAEEALNKLKITPKEAQKRYSDYLMASGANPMKIVFSTMNIDDPAAYLRGARKNIEKAAKVRAVFSTYEAALEDTEAEKRIKASEQYIDDHFWGWTTSERKAKSISGSRMFEIDDQRRASVNGYCDALPEPETLSDVVREFEYWDWLYGVRDVAYRELGDEYGYSEHHESVSDRENYLEKLLATIKPVSRQEAIDVCKWVLDNELLNDLGERTNSIILNLVGECG
ncbi:helix-turn-helix domain-containing protein [Budviciaceae bacterium CWB-B4]|uniref:Helix-turn-helix domain-containing protein n=1 Tax=Limnobaculum xujianqingii TaxID=2738837 RepID=A0A9D7FWG7_9GAMM|nr:helix-turn-helix domain-containing protein [Limnobaculum xujianqingii]MBK5072211.1 helix-turn-helix domain-containing protein [Limnobaculum xujianqingii]MBK5175520.1 helix-turn-helix domain-containing protein [Limnobaculum xujianqingii]